MLPNTLPIALKEWAVIQRALLDGHQIVLLRKGGIVEDTGDFDLKARDFVFFPTYLHETERAGDVQPCFGQWLREEEARRPEQGVVRIEAAAHVTDVVRVDDRNKLRKLSPQHIWSAQFINGRFDWEPYKPIFALIVRAFALPRPHLIPLRREYGGCRSWVEMDGPVSTEGAVSVLPDAHFARRRELTLALLTD